MSLLHRITPPLGFLRCLLPLAALGAVALFAPRANAQITFTVNSFTNDSLSVTLNPGTLLTTGMTSLATAQLTIVDANNNGNLTWVNSTAGLVGGGNFGSAVLIAGGAGNNSLLGNYIGFEWVGDLSTAGDLTSAATFTLTQTGIFNVANVAQWALYWGSLDDLGVLQSTGNATAGSTSVPAAVPEPSTYAAIFGAFALGFVAWRRRQSQVPAATA